MEPDKFSEDEIEASEVFVKVWLELLLALIVAVGFGWMVHSLLPEHDPRPLGQQCHCHETK
jgi:hypothetical protein